MAELIMLVTMLLFVGLCAVILGMGIYEVYVRKNGGETVSRAAAQTNREDHNTCA